MKKNLLFIAAFLCIGLVTFSQAPQSIPYQAVARDASGNLLQNTTICVQYRVYNAASGGTLLYEEHHQATTNNLGLFSLNVGTGGTYDGGSYTTLGSINWGANAAYVEIGLDITGGCTGSNTYTTMGRSQMMSVPFALYAGSAASASGAAGGDLTGTYPNPNLAAVGTAGTYGTSSTYPVVTVDSKGRVTNVTTDALPTSLPPSGTAGGDLNGTYPNPAVVKINGTSLAGLSTGLLKNTTGTGVPTIAAAGTDYVAPTGNGSGLTSITAANISAGTAGINITGNATTATSAGSFTGSLAGDVTGTQAATLVGKINGSPLGTTTGAATGNVLKWNGSAWTFGADANSGGTVTSVGTTAPLTGTVTTSGTIGITQATASTNGYLSSTDWATFNGKQAALTFNSPLVNTSNTVTCPTCVTSTGGGAMTGSSPITVSAAGAIACPTCLTGSSGSYILNQTTPQSSSNFNISGNGTIGGNAVVSGTVAAGQAIMGTNINGGYYQDGTNGAYRSILPSTSTSGFYFQTNGGTASTMYIGVGGTYNGNVGIGTITPGQALTVVDAGNTNKFSGTLTVMANNLTAGVSIGYAGLTSVGNASNLNNPLFIGAEGTGNVLIQTQTTPGNVGIGAANTAPVSVLSVGGAGNALWEGYFNNATTASNYTVGVFGQATTNSISNTSYGVQGNNTPTSATGYSVGVYGTALGASLQTNGRAYGVRGMAGNATTGYNYGVFGDLQGTGNGAAIYGVNTAGSVSTTPIPSTFAGWFDGNVNVNGFLGVGTTTPLAPVYVTTYSNSTVAGAIQYVNPANTGNNNQDAGYNSSWTGQVSIYAAKNIVSSASCIAISSSAYSDNRIKNIIGVSNGHDDLEKINKIQITKYKYIDTISIGNGIRTKVIAQQVEKVYPEAVSQMTNYIPNVYALSQGLYYDSVAHLLTITVDKPHGFTVADKVKLIGEGNNEIIAEVKAVNSPYTFTVPCSKAPDKLFVYGKEVKDFRMVDYEALSMLGISALQEISRKVDALESANKTLQNENKDLQINKVDKSDYNLLKAQIDDLKTLMEKNGIRSQK